ncbi:hypothetical protein TNCV_300821 [Trichonephila clavipes]|nr:hypothetical protein TNCV_300821 [Trichonephila clavipes]
MTTTVANIIPKPVDDVRDQEGTVILPQEVGEKGFLESISPSFQYRLRQRTCAGTDLRVPAESREQKCAPSEKEEELSHGKLCCYGKDLNFDA